CNSNPDEFSPYSAILSFTTTAAGQTGITAHSCGATNVHNPAKTYGSMTDQQGNTYRTIVIVTQEWMAENLRTTIYRNGDAIANVTDGNQWANLTTGAWCHYNNNSSNECPFGKLYNWYAVADPRNVCPSGWHVPTDAEWTTLTNFLGGEFVAGGKMKSTGTQYWLSPNQDATNESGFSGLPGGYRSSSGYFGSVGYNGYWWSSSESSTSIAWYLYLYFYNGSAARINYPGQGGLSVRCLRDLPAGGRLDEKNEIEHVIIYPNPTNNNINIVINAVSETQTTIRITDLLGRVMLTETEALIGGNNTITYNISDYAAGVYLVHVGNGNTQQVYKVVKE
ncbi:MAG: T9SS type A sorting domain-containing protein, partial [Bacteroidetes bacterium]|nr:T9SS type A sorting domain-containing protein [Bacteroidota bacterium]